MTDAPIEIQLHAPPENFTAQDVRDVAAMSEVLLRAIWGVPDHLSGSVMITILVSWLVTRRDAEGAWRELKADVDRDLPQALAIGDVAGTG